MFPSIPHSLTPLDILEQRIHSQSDPLYEVIHRAEACTTGFGTSRLLPEPKAARVVWAVSLSVETTQLVNGWGAVTGVAAVTQPQLGVVVAVGVTTIEVAGPKQPQLGQ